MNCPEFTTSDYLRTLYQYVRSSLIKLFPIPHRTFTSLSFYLSFFLLLSFISSSHFIQNNCLLFFPLLFPAFCDPLWAELCLWDCAWCEIPGVSASCCTEQQQPTYTALCSHTARLSQTSWGKRKNEWDYERMKENKSSQCKVLSRDLAGANRALYTDADR